MIYNNTFKEMASSTASNTTSSDLEGDGKMRVIWDDSLQQEYFSSRTSPSYLSKQRSVSHV